jgi:hypothetical protein
MAVQEYEPRFDSPYAEEEIAPLDNFKDGLHAMVTDVESSGISALGHLNIVRHEMKRRYEKLVKQSYSDNFSQDQLSLIYEEAILTYHKWKWTMGYIQDRQPK